MRELTAEQHQAFKNLRAAWYKKKAEVGSALTQKKFGEAVGWKQSVITQYLTGRIALNLVALNRFCKELEVDPFDIYPELAAEAIQPKDTIDGQIVEALKNCPQQVKENILSLVQAYKSD